MQKHGTQNNCGTKETKNDCVRHGKCFDDIMCEQYVNIKDVLNDWKGHTSLKQGWSFKDGADPLIYEKIKNPYARVGACVATKKFYGPSKMLVRCKLKKTDWDTDGPINGRGQCFAIWTFGYSEIYSMFSTDQLHPSKLGISAGTCSKNKGCCWNPDDGKNINCSQCTSNPIKHEFNDGTTINSPWLTQCTEDSDYFTTLNHEIDIEVPVNSPQFNHGMIGLNIVIIILGMLILGLEIIIGMMGQQFGIHKLKLKLVLQIVMEHVVLDVLN